MQFFGRPQDRLYHVLITPPVRQAAEADDATVLILGETGTGKERAFEFATTKSVTRVGVLSATNSLPTSLIDTPFVINSALVFFSNGGEYGVLLAEDRPQKNCSLCAGTGRIMFDPIAEDVCPRCEYTGKKSKNWLLFAQAIIIKGPLYFSMPFRIELGD